MDDFEEGIEVLQQMIDRIKISEILISTTETTEDERLDTKFFESKRKIRNIYYEDSILEEVIISKINNFEKFKTVVDEVLNTNIEINEKCGITLVDVSKTVFNKLENHKGKKLGDQESLYVLNKLREKYPNRLFKRDMMYCLYDVNTKKHSSATTVFGGLMLKDRPRLLPKIYKL